MSFTDTIEYTLLGQTLYTSPSQEGILQANEPPPVAKDICVYNNFMLYANTQTKHRLFLTVIKIGGTEGIVLNDTLVINGITYTAKNAENIAAGEFLIDSISADDFDKVANTAKNLVRVINGYASNTAISAYYLSGYDDEPGKILLERNTPVDTVFYATYQSYTSGYNGGKAFNPVLPESGTTVSSANEVKTNRVYYSKQYLPEYVPLLNYFDAGNENSAIIRIVALRESVYIFKDDGEIYRFYGNNPDNFTIRLFDSTAKIYGGRTAVAMSNKVYLFSDQGVIAVSDSGIELQSFPIRDKLQPYLSLTNYPLFKTNAYGIAYESDNKYILGYGSTCYVLNTQLKLWSTWGISAYCGEVGESDDKLYFGKTDKYVHIERKNIDKFDYCEDEFDVTITGRNEYQVYLADNTGVTVGDSIKQGTRYAKVTSIDSGYIITVDKINSWQNGTAQICEPITCQLRWQPTYGSNPAVLKRFSEITIIFIDNNGAFNIYFKNNFNGTEYKLEVTQSAIGSGWGTFPWGTQPWGGAVAGSSEIRTYLPIAYQRALWQQIKIEMEECFRDFSLTGINMVYDINDVRFRNPQ